MAPRILVWASAGLALAACCAVYALVIPITTSDAAFTLARITQPVVLLGSYFHFGVSVGWVLLANAATYAMLGLSTRALQRRSIT